MSNHHSIQPTPQDTEDTQVWSDIAQLYDRIIPQFSYYQELLDKVISSMKDAPHVLDCGCGTGLIMTALLHAGHHVLAVDNSPSMLELARAKLSQFPPSIVKQAQIKPGDPTLFAQQFPDSNLFDGIVCNNVLFYVVDPISVMQQTHRLVRPGGVVAFSGPIPDANVQLLYDVSKQDFQQRGIYETFAHDLERFLQFSLMLKRMGHRNTYQATELAEILTQRIGFSRIRHLDQETYCGQSYFVVAEK